MAEIQDLTIKLEIDIVKHIKDSKNFNLNQFDSKSVITQTEQIWRLLRRCETPLKDVTMAVEKKASADRSFFQKASLGIGAVCAGNSGVSYIHYLDCKGMYMYICEKPSFL